MKSQIKEELQRSTLGQKGETRDSARLEGHSIPGFLTYGTYYRSFRESSIWG